MKPPSSKWWHEYAFAAAVVIIMGLVLVFLTEPAKSNPIVIANSGAVSIVLHDDPCALTDLISNLGRRATWVEGIGGKSFEGCWSVANGLVVMYFDDKTVAILPTDAFKKVQGI